MELKKVDEAITCYKKVINIQKDYSPAYDNLGTAYRMKGDFITAPNISVLFSEMIAIWIVAFWKNLNCPNKINLVERVLEIEEYNNIKLVN